MIVKSQQTRIELVTGPAGFQHMLRGEEEIEVGTSGVEAVQMLASSAQKLKDKFPKAFENIMDKLHTPEFSDWMRQSNPQDISMDFSSEGEKFDDDKKAINHLLAVKTFRPDRFVAAGERFIGAILGESFRAIANSELDLAKIVTDQIRGNTPILMCSVPGYDASGRVDDLAAELGSRGLSSVAIGSEEGFNQADKVRYDMS